MVAKKSKSKNTELIVLTQRGCPACEALKNQVHNVKYRELDTDADARKLADRLGVNAVPTVLRVNSKTGKTCVLDNKLRPVKCLIDKK